MDNSDVESNDENAGTLQYLLTKYGIMLEQLTIFRKISNTEADDANLEIPAPSNERIVTDRKGFLFYGIGILICLPTVIFSSRQHVNDNIHCTKLSDFESSSENAPLRSLDNQLQKLDKNDVKSIFAEADFRHYHEKTYTASFPRRVHLKREVNKLITNKTKKLKRSTHDYRNCWQLLPKYWWKLTMIVIKTTGICALVLFLIKVFPFELIWLTVSSTLAFTLAMAVLATKLYRSLDLEVNHTPHLFIVISTYLFFAGTLLVAWSARDIIRVTGLLYRQTGKLIFAMPILLLLSLMMMLIQLTILNYSLNAALKLSNDLRTTHKGFFLFLNIFITNWTMHLIGGIQCMITASTVASYHFSRNRQQLDWTNCRSFGNTLKYHIGSVAFGSAAQPFVAIGRTLARLCCGSCFVGLDVKLTSFSNKYAYIMSALHGQPYGKSGKRAFNLLITFAPSFLGLKARTDMLSLMIQVNVILCSTGISYLFWASDNVWLSTVVCYLFIHTVIVSVFFETIETAAYTLLISYCEDNFIRGDTTRPRRLITEDMNKLFEQSEDLFYN